VDVLDPRPGLVWFRRDLRLGDNPTWAAATSAHEEVIAIFVLEPELMEPAGRVRRDQMLAHLHALDQSLTDQGARLVVRPGPAQQAIPQAIAESDASALYLNADGSPFSLARDDSIRKRVEVPVQVFHGLTVHEPGAVLTRKGTLSQVFSAFHNQWVRAEPTPWPSPGPGRPVAMSGDPIPAPAGPVRQAPGEAAAWQRVTDWLECVDDYPDTRDLPAQAGTSDLSADLKFGTLAARTLVEVVGDTTPGRAAFVRQLAWRDWWAHTLVSRPDLAHTSLRPEYDHISWRDDPAGFETWCAGRTGYPIVDAGMRQLTETGWMHNRTRMICASFLVKDLLIDWRRGERFFRHHLVDADIAQNAGNWQWVAGTGPDAAPYFRIFNPTTQGQKFDPRGDYIRRWVPELSRLAAPPIHRPAGADPSELAEAGVTLGQDYPMPIVEHQVARTRALDSYRTAVEQSR
jgi:deoxyribodipyrimidine photo-lyase